MYSADTTDDSLVQAGTDLAAVLPAIAEVLSGPTGSTADGALIRPVWLAVVLFQLSNTRLWGLDVTSAVARMAVASPSLLTLSTTGVLSVFMLRTAVNDELLVSARVFMFVFRLYVLRELDECVLIHFVLFPGWNASDVDAWYAVTVKYGISDATARRVKQAFVAGMVKTMFEIVFTVCFVCFSRMFARVCVSAINIVS